MRSEKKSPEFHVALSFAGEDRAYVERVAACLRDMGLRVFYDKYETVSLWGKDLYTHLREVYFERSAFTVMFISRHYRDKLWTSHERESAQARAFQEHREYVLPARFDDTQVPGLLPTTHYVDLSTLSPEELAQLIKEKIGPISRPNFFPPEPDVLYQALGTRGRRARQRVLRCAEHFHQALGLMTSEERRILSTAALHACPAGLPDDVHLNLEYFSRVVGYAPEVIIGMASRLDCLGVRSRVYDKDDEPIPDGALVRSRRIIEFKFEPNDPELPDNATFVLVEVFRILHTNLCPNCVADALAGADFSVLGTATGFPHREE